MIIFHGSDVAIEYPQILISNRYLDFGFGFYTTTNKEQAISWAKRVCYRKQKDIAYISVFEFDLEKAKLDLNVKEFPLIANLEWLNFVVDCRNVLSHNFDIVYGPIADDNVYSTIKNFESGIYDYDYTIKKLRTQILKDQFLFHTENALKYIKFIKVVEVKVNE